MSNEKSVLAPRPTKKIHIKGGPLGSHLTEFDVDGVSVMKNSTGFSVRGSVTTAIRAQVDYSILDVELEVEGEVTHRVMLQRTEWRTNPVDGEVEKTPHKEYMAVAYSGDGLPDALRKMAAQLEEDRVAAQD